MLMSFWQIHCWRQSKTQLRNLGGGWSGTPAPQVEWYTCLNIQLTCQRDPSWQIMTGTLWPNDPELILLLLPVRSREGPTPVKCRRTWRAVREGKTPFKTKQVCEAFNCSNWSAWLSALLNDKFTQKKRKKPIKCPFQDICTHILTWALKTISHRSSRTAEQGGS